MNYLNVHKQIYKNVYMYLYKDTNKTNKYKVVSLFTISLQFLEIKIKKKHLVQRKLYIIL